MNPEDLFAQFFGGHSSFGGFGDDSGAHSFGGHPFSQFQSQSRHPQKQPKVEVVKRMLPCTLEELFTGFSKKLKITRNVQEPSGEVRQESNVLVVDGKPGWKAGTKLTFPGVCFR